MLCLFLIFLFEKPIKLSVSLHSRGNRIYIHCYCFPTSPPSMWEGSIAPVFLEETILKIIRQKSRLLHENQTLKYKPRGRLLKRFIQHLALYTTRDSSTLLFFYRNFHTAGSQFPKYYFQIERKRERKRERNGERDKRRERQRDGEKERERRKERERAVERAVERERENQTDKQREKMFEFLSLSF